MPLSQRLAQLRERLKRREKQRERKQFERELKRSKRREKLRQLKGKAREKARSKTAPARIEAKAAKRELAKTSEEVSANAIPGGRAAMTAGQAAATAGSTAADAGKRGVSAVVRAAREAEPDMKGLEEIEGEAREGETFRRAEQVARAGPPVDGARLSPAGNPRRFEALGRAGVAADPDETMAGLVMGVDDSDVEEEPLLGVEGDLSGGGPLVDPLVYESGLLGGGEE